MWRSCLGLQLANRMRVLFIRGGGHEGICVFQEGICIPFQVLFFRLKKKKASDFSKCEIISLLFNTGKKKLFQTMRTFVQCFCSNHKLCKVCGLEYWLYKSFSVLSPYPLKMFFNCNVIQKQDLGVFFFFKQIMPQLVYPYPQSMEINQSVY